MDGMKKIDNAIYKKCAVSGIFLLFVLLFVAVGYLYLKCNEQRDVFDGVINNNRKIYVYSLEEVLVKLEAYSNKQKFDEDVIKLNKELLEAEKKIKNIKSAKLKADFSDVYLKNLRMKRDELVEGYQNSIIELTRKINQALADIAREKDASAVFLKSTIAVQTPYVIDLTEEVADRVQKEVKKK